MNQNIDKLPEDAKNIIQAVFDYSLPVSCGFPADAIEVKLDNPAFNLLKGEGTVHFHALGNTEHYLHHRGNDDWAIIFSDSKIGDAKTGKTIINSGKDGVIV